MNISVILEALMLLVDVGILLILVVEFQYDKVIYEKEQYKKKRQKKARYTFERLCVGEMQ
jgi:alpha-N-acetylglucosamine transferase